MATAKNNNLREAVLDALISIYEADFDDLIVLLKYLDLSDEAGNSWSALETIWENVKPKTKAKQQIKEHADKLIKKEKQRTSKDNEETLTDSRSNFIFNETEYLELLKNILYYLRYYKIIGAAVGCATGLAKLWDKLPPPTQQKFLKFLATKTLRKIFRRKLLKITKNFSGTQYMLAITFTVTAYETYIHVNSWQNGKITGKRCAKLCVDLIVEVLAGIGGALAGSALGVLFGNPMVPIILGAVLGGVFGFTAHKIVDPITLYIFDLPESRVVENAFNFLEISHRSNWKQIDAACKARLEIISLEKNPQKQMELLTMLNVCMAIIENEQMKETSEPFVTLQFNADINEFRFQDKKKTGWEYVYLGPKKD